MTDSQSFIQCHKSGQEVIWIDMLFVPSERRRQGQGRKAYQDFEAQLPKSVRLVRLMAADTGAGPSDGFWDLMGFDYVYQDETDYESKQMMWKGVNGHPTPKSIEQD